MGSHVYAKKTLVMQRLGVIISGEPYAPGFGGLGASSYPQNIHLTPGDRPACDHRDVELGPNAEQFGLVTVLCRSPISLSHLGFEGERADAAQI
jgi:hypothetical protein